MSSQAPEMKSSLPRTVLFLGAGASAPFGLPTVDKFFGFLDDHSLWEIDGSDIGLRTTTQELVRRLSGRLGLAKTPWPKFDAEMFFAAIESLASDMPLICDDIKRRDILLAGHIEAQGLLDIFKAKIVNVYDCSVTVDEKDVMKAYENLLLGLSDAGVVYPPLDIFTTNYDQVCERVCRCFTSGVSNTVNLKGASFADGFLEIGAPRRWDPRVVYSNAQVRLYKLHGSVTWKWSDENGRRVPVDIGMADPNPRSDCLLYFGYKSVPTKKPYAYLHECLAQVLQLPAFVVMVGFRLNDPYIGHLFRTALHFNVALKLLVILRGDPPEAIQSLIKMFPGRVRQARCGEYVLKSVRL